MSAHDRISDAIKRGNRPSGERLHVVGADPPSTSWPDPMSDAALHGPAGTVIRGIEEYTEADPAAMLVTFLAAFGNAVGRGPHVRLGSAEHGTNLFVKIVGDTGAAGRKGTSWEEIKRPMRAAAPDWHPTGGIESGQGIIYHVRDPHDVRRKPRKGEKLEVDDEGYVTVREDEGVEDKRLFLLESEFGKVLAVGDRKESTTLEVLKQLWDSGDARTLAKQAHVRTTGSHVSLVGHITPTQLRARLADVEIASGFANRFLFVCSRRSKELPDGDGAPDDVVRVLGDAIAGLIPFARKIWRVELTPDARELWRLEYGRLTANQPRSFINARAPARPGRENVRLSRENAGDSGRIRLPGGSPRW